MKEKDYNWIHIVIAVIISAVISMTLNAPLLAFVSAMVYYLFVIVIQGYNLFVVEISDLRNEISKLKEKTDVIDVPKRGKPRFKPSNIPDEAPDTLDKMLPGERVEYNGTTRVFQNKETKEEFMKRVRMEMSKVEQPSIQDLD